MNSSKLTRLTLTISLFFQLQAGFSPAYAGTTVAPVQCHASLLTDSTSKEKASAFQLSLKVKQDQKGQSRIELFEARNWLVRSINAIFRWLHKPLKVTEIAEAIARFENDPRDLPYYNKLLQAAQVQVSFDQNALNQIPRTGTLFAFSNHPLFGVDGLVIASAFSQRRTDMKVVLNRMLQGIPGLKDHAILVDPFGTKSSRVYNKQKIFEMNEHARNGGAIMIFPAGAVSEKTNKNDTMVEDPEWRKGIVLSMRQNENAVLVPVFTEGEPSKTYIKTRLHAPMIGAGMMLTEIGRQTGTKIDIEIGQPIAAEDLKVLSDAEVLTYLRARTYVMSGNQVSRLKSAQGKTLSTPSAEKIRQTIARLKDQMESPQSSISVSLDILLAEAEAQVLFKQHPSLSSLLNILGPADLRGRQAVTELIAQGFELKGLRTAQDKTLILDLSTSAVGEQK